MSESLIPANVEASTTTEATTTTTESTTIPTTDDTTAPGYLYADGIEAQGDVPEWFKSNKYKTVSEQAAAYPELEKRFGSFTGAPKEGKYEIEGVEFEDNTLLKTVADWGLENQLSQEGLSTLITKVNELAEAQVALDRENALAELGENGTKILQDLAQWGKNNLTPEEYVQFQGLAQNAGQVKLLDKLVGMNKNSKLVDQTQVEAPNNREAIEAKLKEEYVATNDKGQRLMDVDMAYRQRVNAKFKEFYGN